MATVTDSVEQLTQAAWAAYTERLHGLEGREYDHAEAEAWDALQAALEDLHAPLPAPLDPIG